MKTLQFGSLFSSISGLRHAVTTREGGVSTGDYSQLNLAFHVGDDEDHVRQNRRLLAGALGYEAARLVAAQQVHGTNARVVTAQQAGQGAFDWDSAVPDCDALIACEANLPVLIQVADCAPILLVDPNRRAMAVVHAGWRGAVGRIASQTLALMQQELGTAAGDVRVGIGPCLCRACFEVGEEVAVQAPVSCVVEGYEKPHLDLPAIVRQDLVESGVPPQQVEVMPMCPRCQNQPLFSHRGQQGKAGRFGLVAWWE